MLYCHLRVLNEMISFSKTYTSSPADNFQAAESWSHANFVCGSISVRGVILLEDSCTEWERIVFWSYASQVLNSLFIANELGVLG